MLIELSAQGGCIWHQCQLLVEAVEELLKKAFAAGIGEHCHIGEFLNH